ncbi:MAG: hypothetical protein GY810_28475, partial [Aureispira sp.]|nr:hypothetical protein [Aureispira sp.]
GNDYTIKQGGNIIDSKNSAAVVTPDIAYIGKRSIGMQYFKGTPANLILTDDELGETLTFPLLSNDIEYPNENVIGDELWTSPTVGDWVDNGDGSYTLTGDGSYQVISINTPVSGTLYEIEFTVDDINGNMKVQSGGGAIHTFSTTGTHTIQETATANLIGFARSNSSVNCTISNISVRQITNAITFTDVSMELSTLTSNVLSTDTAVAVSLNRAPTISRADLLGGDYRADTLVGAVVRCTDGNAGDGLYIAVGADNTDWQLITTSGTV